MKNKERVLVTGATGFLGFRTVAALLEAGLQVTAMIRPDQEEKLAPFANHINIVYGDVWSKGSLKGRARGHGTVIHLVGSTRANPARGDTFHQINLVSARNVTTMAVSDGVPHMILLSTIVRPLSIPGEYVRSKREAEEYLRNTGLEWTIIRAPALFNPHRQSGLRLMSVIGSNFPLSLLVGNAIPLPVDVAARGIARIVTDPAAYHGRIIYAPQLRRLSRQMKVKRPLVGPRQVRRSNDDDVDEPPFGWLPPKT
ncbi:MAG: NAD(P)H-binding protein [Chloroflexi bacterium]|nr:NAD(P)H-binding protein [Chloroflexota bacterium]